MYIPRDIQTYIMKFVYLCERCDKCMIQKHKNSSNDKNTNEDPFIYWNGTQGDISIICRECSHAGV